jgi:hypothetical protein
VGDDVRKLLDARFVAVHADDVVTELGERHRHGGAEPA